MYSSSFLVNIAKQSQWCLINSKNVEKGWIILPIIMINLISYYLGISFIGYHQYFTNKYLIRTNTCLNIQSTYRSASNCDVIEIWYCIIWGLWKFHELLPSLMIAWSHVCIENLVSGEYRYLFSDSNMVLKIYMIFKL